MEFQFDVNDLFRNEITQLRCDNLRAFRGESLKQLAAVIDKMGEASSKAQGLRTVITSFSRIKASSHRLYIMKNSHANRGYGSVTGILKVGEKRLFVYDPQGQQHEVEPLCVLDFYVHESCQRSGCGRKLFEYMLQMENIKPAQLAIDRPSFKLTAFMQKHYNLRATTPQVNNFIVFDAFFRQPSASRNSSASRRSRRDHYEVDTRERVDSGKRNVAIGGISNTSLLGRLEKESSSALHPSKMPLKHIPSLDSIDQHNTFDRPPSDSDRVMDRPLSGNLSGFDKYSSGIDRYSSGIDRLSSGIDRLSSGVDRPPSGYSSRRVPSADRLNAQQSNYSRHYSAGSRPPPNGLPAEPNARPDSPPTMSRNGPSGDFASFTSQLSPASVNRGSSEPFINELAFKEAPSVFSGTNGRRHNGPANGKPPLPPISTNQQATGTPAGRARHADTSYNIFGIPRSQSSEVQQADRRRQQSSANRLW